MFPGDGVILSAMKLMLENMSLSLCEQANMLLECLESEGAEGRLAALRLKSGEFERLLPIVKSSVSS